jgi:hypothetical protein
LRPYRRSFDAAVRDVVTNVPPREHLEWREQQARRQRYEAMVCEQLGAMWIDEVPRLHERIRRR